MSKQSSMPMKQQKPHDARREFQRSPELQAEFGDEGTYAAYCRGVAAGAIAPPRKPVVATEPNPVASRSANAGLRAIWDKHGPQSGRVYCNHTMERFANFDEFAAHVARHNPKVRR